MHITFYNVASISGMDIRKSLRKCNNENRNHLLLFVLLSRSSKRKWPDALFALYSKEEKLLDPVEEGYVLDMN